MAIEIITRAQWGADAPRRRAEIATPTPELWLHHSAGSHHGAAGVRDIQHDHMNVTHHWSDIAYSNLVDPDSLDVFEGRGVGVRGGHTFGHNSVSHGVCVLGNFEIKMPSDRLIWKLAELVAHGHRLGWWPDQLTGGHRDVRSTACPGKHLYARIPDINDRARQLLEGEPMPPTNEPDPDVLRVQSELVAAGYDLGTFGPTNDGRDGLFGAFTRDAMLAALVDRSSARDEAATEAARADALGLELGAVRAALDELRDELGLEDDEDAAGLVRLGRDTAALVADAGRFSEAP